MTERKITGPLLREAATYLSPDGAYHILDSGTLCPFMCHTINRADGDAQALRALLVECEAMRQDSMLMHDWMTDQSESGYDWKDYELERQSVRFMLLLFLAEMLESEAR